MRIFMSKRWIRQIIFPLLAAIIWGTAFVFQSDAAELIGPFTFNAVRCAMGAAFLTLILLAKDIFYKRSRRAEGAKVPSGRRDCKALWIGGALCGIMLAGAANLQQLGLGEAAPGKAAFITSLYVILVPVLGLFFRKRVSPVIWGSIVLVVIGLYFLCVKEKMQIEKSDFFLFLCALCFAFHIMVVDRVSDRVDGMELSCVQFLVASLISGVGMLLTETVTWGALLACLWPLFYVGVFSGGIAYTLQILAQKNSNPTVVSMLFCLESVFAVLADGLITGGWLTGREWIGSSIMLIAIMMAQLPEGVFKRKKGT